MAKAKIVTDISNKYFTNNKINIGTGIPTTGSYKSGDVILSNSANSTAFGWICTVAGTPGTWKVLQSGTDASTAWGNISGKPSTYAPTIGNTSTTAFRGDHGNTAYTHSQATHAPTNAQRNADITKAEIEAKLTGSISTHTHNLDSLGGFGKKGEVGPTTNWNDTLTPGVYKVQIPSWGPVSLNGPNSVFPSIYSFGLLHVYQTSISGENRTMQIYFPHANTASSSIVTRMLNNNSWLPWSKIGGGLTANDVGAMPINGGAFTGGVIVRNDIGLYGKRTNDTNVNLIGVDTSNRIYVGWGGEATTVHHNDSEFNRGALFKGSIFNQRPDTKTCVMELYKNPDRLEFFWSQSNGGSDWDWGNKSFISADGQIYASKQLSVGGHRITPYSGAGVSIINPAGTEFSGLEVKELWLGPYSGATKKLSMNSSAPGAPAYGDVWIQNN